jgi:dihydrofolate reductase
MKIGMIWAQSENGVIGADGKLPWHLPEDLQHFKETTMGSAVVMGRKTWESIPGKFRPLPGRLNIVLTKRHDYAAVGTHGEATVVCSVTEAYATLRRLGHDRLWVIGGSAVYNAYVLTADFVVRTVILKDFEGDVRAPELPESEWKVTDWTPILQSKSDLLYRIQRLERY